MTTEYSRQLPALDASRGNIEQRLNDFLSFTPEEGGALPVPDSADAPFSFCGRMPVVSREQLSADVLGLALRNHGTLIVRGMADEDFCGRHREHIDGVMDAPHSTAKNPLPEEQVRCFHNNPPRNLQECLEDVKLGELRAFHRVSNSRMCVESTGLAEQLMAFYEERGLKDIVAGYLGESPCLSANKWVLRRVPPEVREDGWHQDGSFMGTGIKSINMWLPLTECGGDSAAPGMDLVPAPIDRIYTSERGLYDWSVATADVDEWFADSPPEAPPMAAGDAIFFDHYSLHRTQYREQFTRARYAIETWFFGERHFPRNQVPLRW